jgi:hypothetical protein
MGPCYRPEQWAPALARFQERRPALDAVWSAIPGLDEKRRTQATRYLSDFWKLVENPRDFAAITRSCRAQGN